MIAPDISITSYISNIIVEHIELNNDEITQLFTKNIYYLKFNRHNNIFYLSVKAVSVILYDFQLLYPCNGIRGYCISKEGEHPKRCDLLFSSQDRTTAKC